MEEKEYFGTNQCGELIERKPDVVRRLAREGKIPFRKLNGRLLFSSSEIREFLDRLPGKTIDEISC
jgi:hypothetical protein